MDTPETNIDRLLKARAEINEQLRQHKANIAVLFTDVVACTKYFDRYGDTAGFVMVDRHAQLGARTVREFDGRVVKTIGDSVMAEFSDPIVCVRAAIELQRKLYSMNEGLPERDRLQLRIGINYGSCFRQDGDLFGDAVNVAARITKHTGPGQILISSSVHRAIQKDSSLICSSLGKMDFKGKEEKEEIFEVVWTDPMTYSNLRTSNTVAVALGELVSPGLRVEDLAQRPEDLTHLSAAQSPMKTPAVTSGGSPVIRTDRAAGSADPDPPSCIETGSHRTPALSSNFGCEARYVPGTTLINRYRIVSPLGKGGMGEVWLAEQKTPIHRTVALKLIKAGMDTKAVVARFESEQQALALMDHPSIAKVFDAGSTAEGRPYFVMEYVPGVPITEYCDKHRLPVRARLELFMQVCDGVQHAHQKAIIHRDLKPSNVLVVEQDNKAAPKIIDFGLAKAMAQRLTDKTMFTELGVMMGTPEYMSPEQADQREQNIDTRTDVYSLGVILYQLLVGALPFDVKTLRAAGIEALLRAIREQEPPKPSTRIRSMGEASVGSAEKRREEPRTFARHLRGELDWITMKALEKDRTRRYGSPAELGADIGRHLHNEPVRAHPPSPGYLAGKYIRRHQIGVAAAAAGLLLLVGFAITQAVGLRRITRERDRADRVTAFMTNMFKVSDPSEARGNTVTAREILDKAAKEIDTGLSNDPEQQAKMMHTMAVTYDGLGLYSRAQPLLERALEIQRRTLGARNPDTQQSMAELAKVWAEEGHYAESEKLIREVLEIRRRVLGPEHPDTLNSMNDLAVALREEGRYAEAEKLQRDTLDIQRRVLGPDDRYTLVSMSNLALTLMDEGHYSEFEKLSREILEIRRRVLGPDHPDTLNSMTSVASALMAEGRYAEAEKMERETLDIQRRVLGPEHPETLREMSSLALILMDEDQYAEAEKMERETLGIQRRVLGSEHTDTLYSMNLLADTLMDEGKYAESEKLNREILEIRRRVLGPKHANTLRSMNNLAVDLSHEKRYGEAENLFREAIQTADKTNHPDVLDDLWYNFACAAAIAGRRDEALEYLGRAVDLGFSNADAMAADNDLKSLHADPRFEALFAKVQQRAAAVQESN